LSNARYQGSEFENAQTAEEDDLVKLENRVLAEHGSDVAMAVTDLGGVVLIYFPR
jgi:hypothetical protein